MKIDTTESYTLVTVEENSFNEFYQYFEKQYVNFQENHLIIDFSSQKNVVEKNISLFLSYASMHKKNGMSFVLICTNIDIDAFPEEFNIVPTLQEAEDVIEMENIQRDLGF
ncbi:conserved protein of unknown function [Tenacibaculum sp. 190130A14a]|uniref:Uncharacterized protein n=1 Tax=Tenacibaculum polynesiense TaxID=3137857 RepID=A0ABM9PD10_9FLAO